MDYDASVVGRFSTALCERLAQRGVYRRVTHRIKCLWLRNSHNWLRNVHPNRETSGQWRLPASLMDSEHQRPSTAGRADGGVCSPDDRRGHTCRRVCELAQDTIECGVFIATIGLSCVTAFGHLIQPWTFVLASASPPPRTRGVGPPMCIRDQGVAPPRPV